MNVVGQILGENTPGFSEEFNDTLGLMHYLRLADERWHDHPHWTRDKRPALTDMKRALSAYETKHGVSNITTTLNRQVSVASRRGKLSPNFWFDTRTYLLFQTFRAMISGRMNPLSGVDSILHGTSLDFTLDPDSPVGSVVIKAIADVNGYDVESVMSSAILAGLMGDD